MRVVFVNKFVHVTGGADQHCLGLAYSMLLRWDAAERAFALFTASERQLVWTEGNGHIITVDYGRDAIFAAVASWLSTHAPRGREERSVG